MSDAFGITGIGTNPYLSGLGMYGLGGAGAYSSLPDYSSMMTGMGGMNPMLTGMNPLMSGMDPMMAGMGMGAMGGMYYPTFMAQMQQMQRDSEKAQAHHAADMHDITVQNQVDEKQTDFNAIVSSLMVDGGIRKHIKMLHDKAVEGDQDGICIVYDQLKSLILSQYSDEFKKRNVKDYSATVNGIIKDLYTELCSAAGQERVSLDNDIKRYGETSFMHGFWANLHGKDYHSRSSEETLAYINGTRIDNIAGKERMEKIGARTESVTEVIASPFVGAAAGYGAAVGLAGLGKFISCGKIPFFKTVKYLGKAAGWVGALAALGGDILWQMSR